MNIYLTQNGGVYIHSFSITPEENSDYKFTLTCSEYDSRYDNIALTVTNKGKTVEPVPESETNSSDKFTYHYALKKGEKYIISVKYLSNAIKAYNLTAEQDNWVYAPNGGRWVTSKVSQNEPYEKIFISPKLLVESPCKVLPDAKNYTIYECYTTDDVDQIMAKITYDDPTAKADLKETITDAVTVGGFAIMIVGLAIPGIREGTVLYAITVYGGASCTTVGASSWLIDKLQLLDY
jgi:hypothetical protein